MGSNRHNLLFVGPPDFSTAALGNTVDLQIDLSYGQVEIRPVDAILLICNEVLK